MLSFRHTILLLTTTLLIGCQGHSNLLAFNLAPEELGNSRVLQMQTQISYGDQSYAMENIVDISKEKIQIIGTAGGIRIFTIIYNGNEIINGPGIGMPFYFPINSITEDNLFVLASPATIQSHLTTNYTLESNTNEKKLLQSGKVVMRMERRPDGKGNSIITLYRTSPEYKLNIVMSEVK